MPKPFTLIRRVEFGDTDMAGIMHFSNFFRFMEAAESAFLRANGLSVSWIDGDVKLGFPRVSASCDYKKPARFEDEIAISVFLEELGRKSVSYRFEFRLREQMIAEGKITAVFCRSQHSGQIESCSIPDEIRAKLEAGRDGQS